MPTAIKAKTNTIIFQTRDASQTFAAELIDMQVNSLKNELIISSVYRNLNVNWEIGFNWSDKVLWSGLLEELFTFNQWVVQQ